MAIYTMNSNEMIERRAEQARKTADILAQQDLIHRTRARKEEEQLRAAAARMLTASPSSAYTGVAIPPSAAVNNNTPRRN